MVGQSRVCSLLDHEAGNTKFINLMPNNKKQLVRTESKLLSPRVRKLRGILNEEAGLDYKNILAEELSKKYRL